MVQTGLNSTPQQVPAGLLDAHRSRPSRLLLQHRKHSAARQRQQAHRTCRASSTANPPRPTRPAGAVSPWSPPQQQQKLPSLGYDRDFSERYSLDQPLGAGSFKTVFVGRDRQTGDRVAVAVIGKERDGADVEHNMRRIAREVGHCGCALHPTSAHCPPHIGAGGDHRGGRMDLGVAMAIIWH